MGRTLLIGSPRVSWREWLREHRGEDDYLCLDPSDPHQGVPGRLALFRSEHPVATRLFGSLDAQRAPHILLAFLGSVTQRIPGDAIVQLFPYRPSPLLRQTVSLAVELVDPTEILVAQGAELDCLSLPATPREIELEAALPPSVQHAQRKAQWLRLIEECETHEVDMSGVSFEGCRLGSGRRLSADELARAGLGNAVYGEKCGPSLLVVMADEPEERIVSRAMDVTGSSRIHFVEPHAYDHLMCAFARPNGEEIGTGFVRRIDWRSRTMVVDCTAVRPVPVQIVRIGALRVDPDGRELGEVKPWQV